MLAYLSGTVQDKQPGQMMITVGAAEQGRVGYEVKIPDHPRYDFFSVGDTAEAYIYTHVREDALDLFGFISPQEKLFFIQLISVSGVGPKLGLGLLSFSDERGLIDLILREDKAELNRIPGVGKKTAERMILELKDSLKKKVEAGVYRVAQGSVAMKSELAYSTSSSEIYIESLLALQGLGFKEVQAKKMIEKVIKENGDAIRTEDVIKKALGASLS